MISFFPFIRYKTLSLKERKILEEDEDELLGILLHNMIAYMVCMGVTEKNIKFKVRMNSLFLYSHCWKNWEVL